MQTSDAIASIALAFAKAQAEFKNPEKNREVEVQPKKRDDGTWPQKYKFKYATFDAILEMARPILSKNEIALIQTAANSGGNIAVTTRFIHSSGEWIEDTIGAAVEGRGLQALGSTLTYLKRYALTAMLGVAADEDDDANSADGNLAEVRDRDRKPPAGRTVAPASPPSASKAVETLSEAISEDWKTWIADLKHQITDAVDYVSAVEVWNANGKTLAILKKDHPVTMKALADWMRIAAAKKPMAA